MYNFLTALYYDLLVYHWCHCLSPTGDENGTYRFMSLKTGQVLTKGPGSWMEVPITDIAIAHVEALAKQEGQPLIQDSNLLVEW